jgi:hypothetical protein
MVFEFEVMFAKLNKIMLLSGWKFEYVFLYSSNNNIFI